MINGILGKKLGMTQIYSKDGNVIPVTVIEAGPCTILQVKTKAHEGYTSAQMGFDIRKESRTNKPQMGRFKKLKVEPVSFIKEIIVDNVDEIKAKDSITVEMFTPGDYVDITASTIGKGFQGGVKRWNWSRGPMSHGSRSHRAPGSIGVTDPPRVLKGKHLPGHMGNKKFTVQGLEVVESDNEKSLLLVKGAVPGPKNGYLIINKSKKKKKKVLKPKVDQAPKKINPLKQSKKSMKK